MSFFLTALSLISDILENGNSQLLTHLFLIKVHNNKYLPIVTLPSLVWSQELQMSSCLEVLSSKEAVFQGGKMSLLQ